MGTERARRSLLADYIVGAAAWYGALGMQIVMVAWLVMDELEAPNTLGLVRGMSMAPILLLLLLGGLTADRVDRRRLVMGLYLLASALTAGLALVVHVDLLELWMVILYVVSMGCVTAFLQPARDALLSEVAQGDMSRPVAAITMTQFAGQSLGALAAGSAKTFGMSTLLGFQCALLLLGAVASRRLPPSPPTEPRAGRTVADVFSDAFAGVGEIFRSPTMGATTLLMTGVGLFFMGAFSVALPLLVYDHHQGDVSTLSFVISGLQAGTVIGAASMLTAPRIGRRGLALALSLASATLPILALSLGLPFAGTLVAAFIWGIFVAGFLSIGRAIIQEAAPPDHRARVLAAYALSMQGAAVIGAPAVGLVASWLGTLGAFAFCAGAMLLFIGLIATKTQVLRIR